jgi:hypothetical protein
MSVECLLTTPPHQGASAARATASAADTTASDFLSTP